MTDTLGQPNFFARLEAMARGAGRFMGRAGFGLMLVAAALAALIATTLIGFILALAALFLTFGQKLGNSRRKDAAFGSPETLDAHSTPDGWVIETHSLGSR